MFLGTHTPRLDAKGRLALPARFRPDLDTGLVITKGQERCLFVFPLPEFTRITDALRTAPVTARAVRDYSRVFFASASHEVPDFAPGDTLKVHVRVIEGNKERVQVFQGVVIKRQGGGVHETFTVRMSCTY